MADTSLSGLRVSHELNAIQAVRGLPRKLLNQGIDPIEGRAKVRQTWQLQQARPVAFEMCSEAYIEPMRLDGAMQNLQSGVAARLGTTTDASHALRTARE